jgi:signal transduction histidine kinase
MVAGHEIAGQQSPGGRIPDPHTPPPPEFQERLERLLRITVDLTSEISLDRVLQQVTDTALDLIGARYAAIGVMSPDGKTLESFTTSGMTPEERERIGPAPRGHGILGLVVREARVIRLPDLTSHPDSQGFPPHHPPMRSFLGVPIIGRHRVFGNLYLTEKLGGLEFTEDDERIALLLASQTAAAVDNARSHEESARLLDEVQQLHRARERFFAMVNHELRNALAGTFGWAELLVRKKDPATVPRAAFEVLDSAGQAIALINDLLDLSRLDEDRLKPQIQAVEPSATARRAIGRVTPTAEAVGVSIVLTVEPNLPTCETDTQRVEQILVNLLVNAVRHAPGGSAVDVRIERSAGRVAFVVEDRGPGIPEEDLESIFDVYVTKAPEESRGSGLGLPLSRRLANLLKGELRAVHRPGAGGCFVLELPTSIEP